MATKIYEVEVESTATVFRFRILCSDGRCSRWASYTAIAQLDDVCVASCYYVPPGKDFTMMSAKELLSYFSVGEDRAE